MTLMQLFIGKVLYSCTHHSGIMPKDMMQHVIHYWLQSFYNSSHPINRSTMLSWLPQRWPTFPTFTAWFQLKITREPLVTFVVPCLLDIHLVPALVKCSSPWQVGPPSPWYRTSKKWIKGSWILDLSSKTFPFIQGASTVQFGQTCSH